MGSRIQCFEIEKVDRPLQWMRNDGTHCAEDDPHRHKGSPWYRRKDTGEEFVGAPPGAVFYYDDIVECTPEQIARLPKGPDGRHLVVVLPDSHWWSPDSNASNSGTPWQRTGTMPVFDVNPSILTHKPKWTQVDGKWKSVGKETSYHGFLRNGWLEEC